ncbi:MAG TPA: Gfo/Idh/MocA family oxidoreductase [Myxococcota bacterium]|nr:Gfo/Idh/MocA family oxidoreductase [Myxococcota bacterium]
MAAPAPPLRFAVIGVDHPHVFGQVAALLANGGELVAFHVAAPGQADGFARFYPNAKRAHDEREILEDSSIQLVTSASIPSERAPLGVRVMRHGKDFLVDKPGMTSLAQLEEVRRVQAETRRMYSVFFSERFESRATTRAAALAAAGAIGRAVQTIGLGPHRANLAQRPPWFFQRARYGGILCDIASHQVDQFLHFTGATDAEVVAATVANWAHPEHPELEDFGELHLRGERATGTVRVDWYTPDALPTWGDGRLFVLGTEGYVEVRKYCDVAGAPGGEHLFLVNRGEVRRFDCRHDPLPFGAAFAADVRERTETSMTQAHCFLACELTLRAQASAVRLGHLEAAS